MLPDVSGISAGAAKIATAFFARFCLLFVGRFLPDHIRISAFVKNKIAELPVN